MLHAPPIWSSCAWSHGVSHNMAAVHQLDAGHTAFPVLLPGSRYPPKHRHQLRSYRNPQTRRWETSTRSCLTRACRGRYWKGWISYAPGVTTLSWRRTPALCLSWRSSIAAWHRWRKPHCPRASVWPLLRGTLTWESSTSSKDNEAFLFVCFGVFQVTGCPHKHLLACPGLSRYISLWYPRQDRQYQIEFIYTDNGIRLAWSDWFNFCPILIVLF